MLHDDTWEAIASGAANSATTGDIESACDTLEHAALLCERQVSRWKGIERQLKRGGAHLSEDDALDMEAARSTANELRTFVKELRAADAAVSEED